MEKQNNQRLDNNDHYEIFILLVTFISLGIIVAYYVIPMVTQVEEILRTVDLLICLIFFIDFLRTLVKSTNRLRYFFTWGWLDLLGSLPQFPLLRLLRIGRIWYSIRTLRGKSIARLLLEARENQAEVTLFGLIVAVLVTLTVGSIAVVLIESEDPTANIETGPDALWWAFVTIATVGYGDYAPVTNMGRGVAVLFMVVGISLFSILTSYLSNRFQARKQQQQAERIERIEAKLEMIIQLLGRENNSSITNSTNLTQPDHESEV